MVITGVSRLVAAGLARLAAAQAIAEIVWNHHVQAEVAKAIEFNSARGSRTSRCHRKTETPASGGVRMGLSSRGQRGAKDSDDTVAGRGREIDPQVIKAGRELGLGLPLRARAGKMSRVCMPKNAAEHAECPEQGPGQTRPRRVAAYASLTGDRVALRAGRLLGIREPWQPASSRRPSGVKRGWLDRVCETKQAGRVARGRHGRS